MATMFPVGQLAFGPGFKDFDKFFVGFDDHVNRLTRINEEAAKTSNNYPPYNIKKTGANSYIIELAVAGFDRSDIDIEVEGDKLIVRGNPAPPPPEEYVYTSEFFVQRAAFQAAKKMNESDATKSTVDESALYKTPEYVFKGIAERAFTRSFSLLGNIKVEAADLKNGMLSIYLMGQEEVIKKIRIAIE